MTPRQLPGLVLLQKFTYHKAIPEGETAIVDGVEVPGKGKPFYHQKLPSGSSIILGDSAPQVPRTIQSTEGAHAEIEKPPVEESRRSAEAQTPQVTPRAEPEEPRGAVGEEGRQPPRAPIKTTADPIPQIQPVAEQQRPESLNPNAMAEYQPYPDGFQIDAKQLERLPDFPQLGRPGRREKPWGLKCFGQPTQGATATAAPTAAGLATRPAAAKKPAGKKPKATKTGGVNKKSNPPAAAPPTTGRVLRNRNPAK
ncbi:MAG: hypothetical protein M1816_004706 [Peltula sp. TS41687]|nr:MAG: hypothetical protein M1816_004706 [Peltula sp. TS41687]